MNALVRYSPPPAVVAAHQARGYPQLALLWHAEALERAARMRGPIAEPAARKLPRPPRPPRPLPTPPSKDWYADAHAVLDDAIVVMAGQSRPPFVPHAVVVKRAVAKAWGDGVTYADICGSQQTRAIAVPRQVAMCIHRWLFPADSGASIARTFDRDHTTLIHALRGIAARMNANPFFAARVEATKRAVQHALMEYEIGRATTRHEVCPADRRESAQPSPKGLLPERSASLAAASGQRGQGLEPQDTISKQGCHLGETS